MSNVVSVPPERQRLAASLLRFTAALDAGTAIVPVPKSDGTVSVPPNLKGGVYKALAGDVYEANILRVYGDVADIDVIVPGCAEPVRLTRVRFKFKGDE